MHGTNNSNKRLSEAHKRNATIKTLSITALLAVLFVTNTAQAQFGNSHGQNFGQFNQNQQQFGGQQQQTRRRGRITPELIQGIIGLFDGGQQSNVNSQLNLTGTWNENLNGFQLQHTMTASNFHRIFNRNTGHQTNSHQAEFDGRNLQLLNGRYTVTEVSPGVLQLRNFKETRTWTRVNNTNNGGGGGVVPPFTKSTGLPQQLQGIWFDISPEGNLWTYVLRANDYDMFEVNPRTNQQVVFDGQPVQVIKGSVSYVNGILHLSRGTDFEEGPFNTSAPPDASQLVLQSLAGEQPRTLTRQRQI